MGTGGTGLLFQVIPDVYEWQSLIRTTNIGFLRRVMVSCDEKAAAALKNGRVHQRRHLQFRCELCRVKEPQGIRIRPHGRNACPMARIPSTDMTGLKLTEHPARLRPLNECTL
ncbi:hypothetical protein GCM10009596_26780 [Arthrobacter rhombi]